MDIGGIGFGPDGTDVFMEGLYIPFLKVLEAGKVNETLMAMIRANTRLPIDTVGDVYSLMACNDVGCRRLVEMMEEFELDNLDALAEHICTKSRAAVLAEIARLPKGSWSNSMTTDGFDGPITLRATTTISPTASTSTIPAPIRRRAAASMCRSPTLRPTPCSGLAASWPARSPTTPARWSPLTVSAPEGMHPQRGQARRRVHPARDRPDAARRGVRLPGPGHSRSRAGRGHVVPVEHHRARLRARVGAGGNYGIHHGDHLQRRHRRAAARRRAIGHGLSVRRQGHASRDRRGHHAADLLEEGAATRLRAAPGARAAGLGQIIEIESGIGEPFELLAAFDRIDHPPRGRAGGKPGAPGAVAIKGGAKLHGQRHAAGAALASGWSS